MSASVLRTLVGIALVLAGTVAQAQIVNPRAAAETQREFTPVKVFLDCVNASCDFNFFRTDIGFVDHVRDRKDADVHVLVTVEGTGGGGDKYSLEFIGLKEFDGVRHVLHYVSPAASTSDELRRGLARVLKLGLVRYAADSAAGSDLQVTHTRRATAAGAALRDPWDYWYLRSNLNVYTNGEELTNSTDLYGTLGASRVTDRLKIDVSANISYGRSRYTLDEQGTDLINISRSLSLNALMVASVTPRWSAGLRASASRSTYYNQRLALRVAPAVEYNIYPYSESTRRQFTFNYSVGIRQFRYDEQTIFDKKRESLPTHSLLASATFKQPWGSLYSSFEASQYLSDASKNRLVLYNSINVRLFKGFSLRLSGDVERIHDQIYLAMGSASIDEILLRRRQLATSYSYYMSFGFGYSFGSIHNNIVNSRFDSSY